MIHDWKMMKLEQYTRFIHGQGYYNFPNGIKVSNRMLIEVDKEFAMLVASLLEGWKYEKAVNEKKGEVSFRLAIRENRDKLQGSYEELLWDLYSLEIG